MTEDDSFDEIPDPTDPMSDLGRAEQRLSIDVERRTYDKPVTVIEGFDTDAVDVDDLASELKSAVGAGGTVDDDTVEIQGDHRERIRDLLEGKGFTVQ